jgi:hypothetical protein
MRGTAGIEFQTGGWTVGKKRGLRCGVPDRAVPGADAAALRSGRTLVMSFVGSVTRRKRKITTQKQTKNKTQLGRAGFFFFQLCDVLVLVIIHKRN